jgi:dCMP deaminase
MIERPDHHTVLMDYARNASRRSTCSRLHVGAVLTADTRLISTGYNGAPSGMPHCDHTCNCRFKGLGFDESTLLPSSHDSSCSAGPCEISVHAEANAIAFAARYGVRTAGTDMYVTHQPCLSCAKLIINAGIKEVHYAAPYRDDSGIQLLMAAGVFVNEQGLKL